MFKVCVGCGEELLMTSDFFSKNKNAKDGYTGRCKRCLSIQGKKNREKNKESITSGKKRYYENNKEVISSKSRVYRELNSEIIRERKRKYREENREAISVKSKLYRDDNKEIISERNKEKYLSNRESVIEKVKEYRNNNKEIVSTRKHRHYVKNKESILTKQKAYYSLNKCWISKRGKTYRKTHQVERRIIEQKRQSIKRKLPSTLTSEQWDKAKRHFGNRCSYCNNEAKLAQDHFVPLSKGGEYTKDNIIPACKSCNSSKNDSLFATWFPRQLFYSKDKEEKILKYLGYKNFKQQLSIF